MRACISHSANVLEQIIAEVCAIEVYLSTEYLPSVKNLDDSGYKERSVHIPQCAS